MTLDVPKRIRKLPVDEKWHLPVPYFVSWIEGKPDFRVADAEKWRSCVKEFRCWICGERMGRFVAFVIGPMCSINRASGDPPMHRDCALYALHTCPFMLHPNMVRRTAGLPEGEMEVSGGTMLERNPGVMLLWMTHGYRLVRDPKGGVLFRLGDPVETAWYCEGREATRAEVQNSFDSGYPFLERLALDESQEALSALERARNAALQLLPA